MQNHKLTNTDICLLCKFLSMCILTLAPCSFCWILVQFNLLLKNWASGFLIVYVFLFHVLISPVLAFFCPRIEKQRLSSINPCLDLYPPYFTKIPPPSIRFLNCLVCLMGKWVLQRLFYLLGFYFICIVCFWQVTIFGIFESCFVLYALFFALYRFFRTWPLSLPS